MDNQNNILNPQQQGHEADPYDIPDVEFDQGPEFDPYDEEWA